MFHSFTPQFESQNDWTTESPAEYFAQGLLFSKYWGESPHFSILFLECQDKSWDECFCSFFPSSTQIILQTNGALARAKKYYSPARF